MNNDFIGKKLADRYEILDLIGTGGMASVYKAKCEVLNRYVAIKVLRDNLKDDPEVVQNFNREAQAAAGLSDNNIVSVFDVGESDGIDYMVMEYVDGITLKHFIKENAPLPWQMACDFAIQIANALSVAHGQKIIHRDIKPQNILMTQDNVLKVTDFGIAKATAAETMIMGGANAMGSVHYISPEQARGGYTDERSDLYSLGIVLYEMLAGKVPFDGDSAVGVALMHIERQPENIRDINHDIPADLGKVVEKAISKEQIKRYQSAADFINDLRAVLAGEALPSDMGISSEEDLGETHVVKVDEVRAAVEASGQEDESLLDEELENKKKKREKKQKTPEQKKADRFATWMALLTILVILLMAFGGYAFYKYKSGVMLVPNLVNKTLEEAQQLCDDKGFVISDSVEYSISDTTEEGKIISQEPNANSIGNREDEIRVIVSLGSAGGNIAVPGVTGWDAEEAITKIIETDLTYAIAEENSDDVEVGKVIRQSPAEGTKVKKDEVVMLHVSVGPAKKNADETETVKMPNLVGETREHAEAAIRDAGLELTSVGRKASDEPVGTVLSQSPQKDKEVKKGSRVSIVLSSGNGSEDENTAAETPEASSTAKATATAKASSTAKPTSATAQKTEEPSSAAVTKSFSFPIPDGYDNAEVKITANGKNVYEGTKSSGDRVDVQITSSGKTTILAYLNGEIVSNKTVDF